MEWNGILVLLANKHCCWRIQQELDSSLLLLIKSLLWVSFLVMYMSPPCVFIIFFLLPLFLFAATVMTK